MSEYTFVSFTPRPALNAALPILLFQSGHGSSAKSHEFLLRRIANEGFVVIVPQHPNDTGNGAYGLPPNKDAAAAVFAGNTIAELQTDGTHLAMALNWAKSLSVVDGQPVDTSRVISGGFSAGAIEAINHAADAPPGTISGLVCISPSTATFVEQAYRFKRSDLKSKTMALTIPALWITSEADLTNLEALDMFKDMSSEGTTLVSFNDERLDLSLKITEEFSIWEKTMAKQNPGLAEHMALACEEEVVADRPIVCFMRRTFNLEDSGPFVASDEMAKVLMKTDEDGVIKTRMVVVI